MSSTYITIMIVVMAITCNAQEIFTCGSSDDGVGVVWLTRDLNDNQFFDTNLEDEEIDIAIPLRIYLVDPVMSEEDPGGQVWDFGRLEYGLNNAITIACSKLEEYRVRFTIENVSCIQSNQIDGLFISEDNPSTPIFIVNDEYNEHLDIPDCGKELNGIFLRYKCFTDNFDNDMLLHELGHLAGLNHTFTAAIQGDNLGGVISFVGPNGDIINETGYCDHMWNISEYVTRDETCDERGDGFCETLAEINPADDVLCNTYHVEWYAIVGNDLEHPIHGKNIYVPNYNELQYWYGGVGWYPVSYLRDQQGNFVRLNPCSMAAVGMMDCQNTLYQDILFDTRIL